MQAEVYCAAGAGRSSYYMSTSTAWWRVEDLHGTPHFYRASYGDTLKDVTLDELFHFQCEIDTGHADGKRFKGHYLDNHLLIVERHPRHLRPLTHEEKRQANRCLSLTQSASRNWSRTPPRAGECAACVRRTNENPTTRQGTPPVRDSNTSVSRAQQLEMETHYFGSSSRNQIVQVQEFALQTNNTLAYLKRVGKSLGLRVTQTARGEYARNLPVCPRIGFGIKRRAIQVLKSRNIRVQTHLFKFGFHVQTGFYEPSTSSARARNCAMHHTRLPSCLIRPSIPVPCVRRA